MLECKNPASVPASRGTLVGSVKAADRVRRAIQLKGSIAILGERHILSFDEASRWQLPGIAPILGMRCR